MPMRCGAFSIMVPRFRGPIVIGDSSKDEARDAFDKFLYHRVVAEYRERKITLVDLNEEPRVETLEILDRDLHAQQVRLAGRLFDPEAFVLGSAILARGEEPVHGGAFAQLAQSRAALARQVALPRRLPADPVQHFPDRAQDAAVLGRHGDRRL